MREIPERIIEDKSGVMLYLDQVENRIDLLSTELEDINTSLQQEKIFFKRWKLKQRKQQIERELCLAHWYEKNLRISFIEGNRRNT